MLREQCRLQRAGGDAIDQQLPGLARRLDVFGGARDVVGAGRDVAGYGAMLGGPAIALVVEAPAIVAGAREDIHHRHIRLARDMQVEGRLRRHG